MQTDNGRHIMAGWLADITGDNYTYVATVYVQIFEGRKFRCFRG